MFLRHIRTSIVRFRHQITSNVRLASDYANQSKVEYYRSDGRRNQSRNDYRSNDYRSNDYRSNDYRSNDYPSNDYPSNHGQRFQRYDNRRSSNRTPFTPLKPLEPPPADLPLHKSFYDAANQTHDQSKFSSWAAENRVTIKNDKQVQPILEFDELAFIPEHIRANLGKFGFDRPTVIQSIAWPVALCGHDLVGISQTGSGKTLGFILPALVHVDGNRQRARHGPSVLVLAPTRELVQQIQQVVAGFSFARSVCVFGGASKNVQRDRIDALKPSIIVACPGRLIDFLKEGSLTLQNISYLVLDEADRMLDMGFEDQIRKIIGSIPNAERQTLMWSATWPREVRALAQDFLTDYTEVNIGSLHLAANHNIKQIVRVVQEKEKIHQLQQLFGELKLALPGNKALIFAETKRTVDFLERQLLRAGANVSAIHGDKSQLQRDMALNDFRNNRINVLIATDVAARGLDVRDIQYVINYDYPNNPENYVHRIGRTGRHGQSGTAITFVSEEDARQADQLINVLREAKQEVSDHLLQLAASARSSKSPRNRFDKFDADWGRRRNNLKGFYRS